MSVLLLCALMSLVLNPALPESVGPWHRSTPTTIQPAGVFDYMDGGGELYLAYNFRSLEVYRYTSPGREAILAEIYRMPDADDAWGLLSGDWGGEPVSLGSQPPTLGGRVPAARALYGGGLLRLAAGNVYARVMAERETGASRDAVLAIGRAIAQGSEFPPPPRLVSALPLQLRSGARLLPDRVLFFRSHLVLNSVYYLGSSNLLKLNGKCEAVTAAYQSGETRERLVIVRYPAEAETEQARASFLQSYLPEIKAEPGESLVSSKVEDGWAALNRRGPYLVLAFRAAGREAAEQLVTETMAAIDAMEGKP